MNSPNIAQYFFFPFFQIFATSITTVIVGSTVVGVQINCIDQRTVLRHNSIK